MYVAMNEVIFGLGTGLLAANPLYQKLRNEIM